MSRVDKFVNKYKGKIVDVEPGWGFPGECVSLVQRFIIEELGVKAKARGNGEAWRTALINEGLGYRVPRSEMRKGDIIAWDGRLGHVAIAMDNDRIFEQEGGSKDTRAKFNSAKVWDRRQGNEGLVTRLKNFVDNDGKEEDTDISKYSDEELAAMVWRGDFGDGQARRDALGSRWSAVQALVDKGVGKPGSSQKPTTPTPSKPKFKSYKLTIKRGSLLYRKNGKAYDKPTTADHTVTIIEEYNGLGRFKASWLVGVSEAWTKLSGGTTSSTPTSSTPKTQYANMGGWTRLHVSSTGGGTYPAPSTNKKTNLAQRSAKIIKKSGNRVQVRIPNFKPEILWLNTSEISITNKPKYKIH